MADKGHHILSLEDDLRMFQSCFNDFDKLTVLVSVDKKLELDVATPLELFAVLTEQKMPHSYGIVNTQDKRSN